MMVHKSVWPMSLPKYANIRFTMKGSYRKAKALFTDL